MWANNHSIDHGCTDECLVLDKNSCHLQSPLPDKGKETEPKRGACDMWQRWMEAKTRRVNVSLLVFLSKVRTATRPRTHTQPNSKYNSRENTVLPDQEKCVNLR